MWGVWENLLKRGAASKSLFRMKGTVSFSVLAPQWFPSPRQDYNNGPHWSVHLKSAFEIHREDCINPKGNSGCYIGCLLLAKFPSHLRVFPTNLHV